MPSKGGFQLTEGDIEILTHVYQLRLSTIDHLVALTGRTRQKVNGRLVRLVERRYLNRRRSSLYEKYIYSIGRVGAAVLVEYDRAEKEIADRRVRLSELTDLFLKHVLMLTEIHTCLGLASRNSPIKLVEWREGKELNDSVTVYENGERVRYPVRPDALFTLQDTRRPEGENLADFFLEADRSTTTTKRFQRKIKGYQLYCGEKRHVEKYGISKVTHIVTLTRTAARAVNLCEASRDVLPKEVARLYFFASVESFSIQNPEPIFDDIFISARDFETGRHYSLIPPLTQ